MLFSVKTPWRRAGHALGLLALIVMTAMGEQAQAAPQTFNTALPVAQGEFVFREQIVLDQSGDDPSVADRDRTAWALVSVLGYGATPELALFGVVPYVDRTLEVTDGGMRQRRGARGLGDISLFGRYTVFRRDRPGRTLRIAPFAGLKLPTGEDDESDGLGRLPQSVQPGSGSWDAFGGVVVTYQTLAFQIDAQASYKANTEANDFEFGDVARLDGSLQYRVWPRELGAGVPGFLYGVLELNLIHQDKNRIGGSDDPNSGGLSLFILPGLQYVTKRWIIEAGLQIPVLQDLNGTGLEKDYILRAGFRLNF
ncbi:MAG: transporter [Alphaproteobacteria bacterium]|nr:transporter [Alphaproteobacteria bacterium]